MHTSTLWSFSKLKIIKIRLGIPISQELLEPLLHISIESYNISHLDEILSCSAHSQTEIEIHKCILIIYLVTSPKR